MSNELEPWERLEPWKETLAPVEGVVLPERIVTDHARKAAHEYNCSPVRIGETDRLKTAEECCLERLLAEAVAQRDEARKDVLVEKKRIEYVQDCLRECHSKLATARDQGREEGLREAARACHISTNLDAERTVLALIPKK